MGRNLTVYCSSSDKLDPPYYVTAAAFGEQMAEQGYTLVYGGGRTGLMGAVARGVHTKGGRVIGVIPGFLRQIEVVYEEADELVITDNLRGRKAEMEQRADAFVVLPGGLGTLEELAEILSLKSLGQINKPLVILNQDGFYNPLLTFFDHLYNLRFTHAGCRAMYYIANDIEAVFAYLAQAPTDPPSSDGKSELWMINRKP